jgi:hypothetical protein
MSESSGQLDRRTFLSGSVAELATEQSGGGRLPLISDLVPSQFTTFDGVIIAASMSSCAARRSSLMLWA